jgi:hypothetical protein
MYRRETAWHQPEIMASAGGLSLQAIGLSGKGMASLPVSSYSHSLAGIRGRKATTGRGEAYALAPSTSTQKGEFSALIPALQLAAEKVLIYTQTLNMFYHSSCTWGYIHI